MITMRFTAWVATVFALLLTAAHAVDRKDLGDDGFWSEWAGAIFERAAKEKKFVIVSLQSWWCPASQ